MKYKHILCAVFLLMGLMVCLRTYSFARADTSSTPATIDLDNPLGTNKPGPTYIFQVIGGRIIQPALGLIGSLALLMFVYGGFVWLTSGGSPDKIKKGRDVFMWAGIGLMIIFSSYILLKFVFQALGGAL